MHETNKEESKRKKKQSTKISSQMFSNPGTDIIPRLRFRFPPGPQDMEHAPHSDLGQNSTAAGVFGRFKMQPKVPGLPTAELFLAPMLRMF